MQKLVAEFQKSSANSQSIRYAEFKQRVIMIEALQAAWNVLARARKTETGTGFYLPESEYKTTTKIKDSQPC